MKKKLISAIIGLLSVSFLLVGCNSNTKNETSKESNSVNASDEENSQKEDSSKSEDYSKKEDSSKKDSKNSSTSENKSKSNDKTTNKVDGKKEYLDKLNSIQEGLHDLDSLYAGSNLEMKKAASEEYSRWDNALNDIYKQLKQTLDKDTFSQLEKEETEWIKTKEDNAKKASKQYEGGTNESLEYTASLASSTKDRCYELVNNYMK